MKCEQDGQKDCLAVKRLLWPLYLCCFASLASMRICDSMLPSLEAGLQVDPQRAACTISVFALAYGVLQLFFGPLGDRFGKVRIAATAALVCALCNGAAAASNDIRQLVLARAASGGAAACIVPLTMAWIGDNVGYDRRQPILARSIGATVLGTLFGQWAGGAIPTVASWRVAFEVVAAVFCVAGLLTLTMARGQSANIRSVRTRFSHDIALVCRTPWARLVLATTTIEGGFAYSALAFLPTHVHEEAGVSMSTAGLVAGLYGVGGLAYSVIATKLFGCITESGIALLGGLLLAISLGTLSVCHLLPVELLACFGAGFGFYAMHNTLQVNAVQMNPGCRGTAVSMFSCALFLGQFIGILSGAQFIQRTSTSGLLLLSSVGLLATGSTFSLLLRSKSTG